MYLCEYLRLHSAAGRDLQDELSHELVGMARQLKQNMQNMSNSVNADMKVFPSFLPLLPTPTFATRARVLRLPPLHHAVDRLFGPCRHVQTLSNISNTQDTTTTQVNKLVHKTELLLVSPCLHTRIRPQHAARLPHTVIV